MDTVFTNGSKTTKKVQKHIAEVSASLPNNPSQDLISEKLSMLTEVLSATFHIKNDRLALVTDVKDLSEGEKISRKLPVPIVPNRYHSNDSYLQELRNSNLQIVRIETPHFLSEVSRIAHNQAVGADQQLGPEYVSHAPFIIYHVTKE